MKKFMFFAIIFILIFSGATVNCLPSVFAATNVQQIKFRAYGDSISAGYGLDDYDNYCPPKKSQKPKTSFLTKDCFTDLLSKPYLEYFGGTAIGYGMDGFTSSSLAEILQPYQSGVANDYQDFLDTDIFTVSVGANNVLHLAAENFQKYIDGTITDGDYRKMLADAVEVFKEDYETVILPTLTMNNAYVLIMTIYNPYKYASIKDITVDTGNELSDAAVKTVLSAIDVTFKEYLNTAMYYIRQINDIIKSSEGERVYVADIWTMCDNLSKEEYIEYFDIDASKIVITEPSPNIDMDLFREYCDPHPEVAGHKAIAEEFAKQFKYFELELSTNPNTIKYTNQNLTFNIKTIQTEKYTYKLMKQNVNAVQEVYSSELATFDISSQLLNGQNNLLVYVYYNNSLVFKSNVVSLDISVTPEPQPETPSDSNSEIPIPSQPQEPNLSTFETVSICFMAFFSLVILFIIINRIKRQNKA